MLGITREELRRARTIAAISIKAKKRVRELGLDDNQRALLEIARRPLDDQALAVEEIVERKRAERLRHADVSVTDKKTVEAIKGLHVEIRNNVSALADRRKRLRLIQDRLAVQEELPPDTIVDEPAPENPKPLSPDDETVFTSLVAAWNNGRDPKTIFESASAEVRESFISLLRNCTPPKKKRRV